MTELCKHLEWYDDPEMGGDYFCQYGETTNAGKCMDGELNCDFFEKVNYG